MAEVYVTKEAQQYSENLISQWLRDSGYDGSLEDGTSLYDVVVRPSGLIYTLFRQNIDKAYAYMSLSKANELRRVLSDEDYDAAIDGIMSNWFVSRNAGGKATGMIRLYFSRLLDFISFSDGEYIGAYGGVNFNARIYDIYQANAKAFNRADFQSVMDTSGNITEYYIDLPVISAENTGLDIPEGSVFTVQAPDVYFVRGVAAADFIPGQDRETSDEFVARTREAITTRELITRRAFHTVLPEQFPEIYSLYVSGCGDPEMIRDLKEFCNLPIHVGNKADLWIGSYLARTQEVCQVQTDDQDRTYIELQNSPVHILSITDYDVDSEGVELDEEHWHYAMEEIDGADDTLETTWFVPGVQNGKIYVELQPLESDEYEAADDDSEFIVTLQHNAVYNKVTEGNDLKYRITLSRRMAENVVVTLSDDSTVTIPSGHTVSEDIVVPTRESDDVAEEDEVIELTISSVLCGGQDIENLVINDPYPVIVTDEEGYIPDNEWPGGVSGNIEPIVRSLTVKEITSDVAANVHEFITNDMNRVASFDPVVKMKVPVVMRFTLNINTNVSYAYDSPTNYNYDAEAAESIKSEIRRVIREYLQNTDVYVESEMVQQLHTEVPMISVVHLPVSAEATFFNMNTGKNVHMTVRDKFSLDDAPVDSYLSRQITTNTIQYYTNDDLITIELR